MANSGEDSIETLQVVGRVVDEAGDAVVNAQVVAVGGASFIRLPIDAELGEAGGCYDNPRFGVTDAQGRFEIAASFQPGEALSISVVAKGYAPLRMSSERLSRGLPHDMGDLVLNSGPSISGTVVDEAGDPLSDVQVLMALERGVPGCFQSYPGRGIPLTKTDADGHFTAVGLVPGRWFLIFDKAGYRVAEAQGNLFNDPSPEIVVTLGRGRGISGRVTNVPAELAGKLIVEARPIRRNVDYVKQFPSRARPRRALVKKDGSFHIEGLNEENARPNISPGLMQGYLPCGTTKNGPLDIWLVVGQVTEPNQRIVELSEFQSCRVEAGATDIELPWLGRASFSARVVDEDGKPVEAFEVEVRYETGFGPDRDTHEATILPGGRLELTDYKAWDFQFQFWQPRREVWLWIRTVGYESREVQIQDYLMRGQHNDFGDIVLKQIPTHTLRVVDADGVPVSNAEVRIAEGDHDWITWAFDRKLPIAGTWYGNKPYHRHVVQTDDQGEVVLSEVTKKAELISVSHPNYAFQVQEVRPTNNEDVPKAYPSEIRLARPGRIMVKVLEQDGKPATWRPVIAETLASDESDRNELRDYQFEAETDANGVATFERLHGRYLVALKHPEHKHRPESQFSDNERTVVSVDGNEVEVTLAAWQQHEFNVTVRESDRPVIGGELKLMSEYLCTQDGDYRFTGWSGVTNDRGQFRFRDVPPGDYVLHVKHDDRNMTSRRKIKVGPGMELIDWLLDNNAITGRLVDPDGNPIAYRRLKCETEVAGYCGGNTDGITYDTGNGRLDWFWSGPWIHEAWSNAAGVFHFRGLVANQPLTLSTDHKALQKDVMEIAALQDGEHREGVTFVGKPAD